MRAVPIEHPSAGRVWTERVASGAGDAVTDDAVLVDRVRGGDASAFEALVERHMRRAYAVAWRVLGQRQDAEDVVQDSFVAALVKIDTFETGRPFAPWLLRIVMNRAINHRAAGARRVRQPMPDDVVSPDPSPLESAERAQLRDRLGRALDALPDPQRLVVQLFDVDGFSGSEVAGMLDMPEGTVRWHLHQARQTLRAALGSLQANHD
jgi:RNA polymerase sigma-70 factor (ECF subfamily)